MKKRRIDVSKLYAGQVFKNYRHLAQTLGWKVYRVNSNSYHAQMKQLSSVCDWRKDLDEFGHKLSNRILIQSVYLATKPVVDGRKITDKTLLTRLISKSILEVLVKYNHDHPKTDENLANMQSLTITLGGLYARIGLVNENYLKGRNHQYELSAQLKLPLQHVNDFYTVVHDNLKKTMAKALNDLESQRLVRHKKTKRLVFKSILLDEVDLASLDEDETLHAELMTHSDYATQAQYEFIFNTERQVLREYGFASMNEVYTKERAFRKRFFRDVVAQVNERSQQFKLPAIQALSELDYYYNALELSFYSEFVEEELTNNELTTEERRQLQAYMEQEVLDYYLTLGSENTRLEINQAHLTNVKTNATRRHQQAKVRANARDIRQKRTDENYVDNIHHIADAVIDRQSPFKLANPSEITTVAIKRKG